MSLIDDERCVLVLVQQGTDVDAHKQTHSICNVRPVIACQGSEVHWRPEALNTGHMMVCTCDLYLNMCPNNDPCVFALLMVLK